MLTRIEIDGFKTFSSFHLDLGPFVVVVGPNASGKSNLFDAIRLLSALARTDLRTALKEMRGEPYEMFRRNADGMPGQTIKLAVEVLLEPGVRDPWGATVTIKHPRVRYEVTIERRKNPRELERFVVTHEKASVIPVHGDRWRPGGKRPSKAFKKAFMHRPGGTRSPFLTTERADEKASFNIQQDGHAGRTRSADAAEATVLSSITSAEFPHLYALREEMRSWRFLQLDPVAMRRPSPTNAAELLEPNGANLAAVLARIQAETKTTERPNGVIADIAVDVGSLIAGVIDLKVIEDEPSREYRVDLQMRVGPAFSSRVVSDGTLRVLALLALLHDPRHRGLICFEEPENGIHPLRLRSLIARLRDLLTDPTSDEVNSTEPLSQMLLNSHSPVVLSCLEDGEKVFADLVSEVDPSTRQSNTKTQVRFIQSENQGELFEDDDRQFITNFEVHRYLDTVDHGA